MSKKRSRRKSFKKSVFKGAIFDLDGVIVDTVPLHFKAWQKTFAEYGREFSFEEYKSKVDGIPRLDGVKAILGDLPIKVLREVANKKQKYFLEYLEKEGVKVYDSTKKILSQLHKKGLKIAVISSSKNCSYILKKAKLYNFIDVEVNGNDIKHGKPDPEIFLIALKRMNLKADECVVFEDAVLGVEAAKKADIFTIGIDRYHNPQRLKKADLVIKDLSELDIDKLKTKLS